MFLSINDDNNMIINPDYINPYVEVKLKVSAAGMLVIIPLYTKLQ